MTTNEKALKMHEEWHGKIETTAKSHVHSREDLSIAYTPGVAEPCKAIANNKEAAYTYTIKSNTVAVVSDGSAAVSYTHLDVYKRQLLVDHRICALDLGKCFLDMDHKRIGTDRLPKCESYDLSIYLKNASYKFQFFKQTKRVQRYADFASFLRIILAPVLVAPLKSHLEAIFQILLGHALIGLSLIHIWL